MARKVEDVFPDSGSQDPASGVYVGDYFMPGNGVRDGKIDGVALSDVAGQHEGC